MTDVSFLKTNDRFQAFSAMDFASVGKVSEERSVKAGKDVYRQDEEDEVTSVFFVKDGKVSLLKSADGKERVLGTLSKGDFFGESSLISPAPHSVTARAEGDVTIALLDTHGYEELQKDAAPTAFKLLDVFLIGLVERLREADARLATKFKKEGGGPTE